jgi:oligopeptide transport system permease protein
VTSVVAGRPTTLARWGEASGPWRTALTRLRRNRPATAGLVALAGLLLAAVLADVLSPYPYTQQNLDIAYHGPTLAHPFGTDQLGRDMLSRLLHGARVSLAVGLVTQVLILFVGVPVGAVAGYFGGKVDHVLMRLVDVVASFPDVLLVIVVMTTIRAWLKGSQGGVLAALGGLDSALGGLVGVFTSLALLSWLLVARVVRGQVLSLREQEFVESARAAGAGHGRILITHLLPNTMAAVTVAATYWVPRAIVIEAALSFIGLGVQPPMTSWGAMILDGYRALRSTPHLLFFPALALSLTVLACNFLGDGLRDALDPWLRSQHSPPRTPTP